MVATGGAGTGDGVCNGAVSTGGAVSIGGDATRGVGAAVVDDGASRVARTMSTVSTTSTAAATTLKNERARPRPGARALAARSWVESESVSARFAGDSGGGGTAVATGATGA